MYATLFFIYSISALICAVVFALSHGGNAKVTFREKEVTSNWGKIAFYAFVTLAPGINTYAAANYVIQFWQQFRKLGE